MKRLFVFLLFFLFICLENLFSQKSDLNDKKNNQEYNEKNLLSEGYQLKVSQLYNLYDKNKIAEALALANEIKLTFIESADTFLVIGNIYFYRKIYNLALDNYLQAEKWHKNFILYEQRLEVLEKISSCYLIQKKFTQSKKIIEEIINLTTLKDKNAKPLFLPYVDKISQKYYYEAQFFLGNFALLENKFTLAQEKFKFCFPYNRYNKLIYLLLCHYLILEEEKKIPVIANISFKKKQKMIKYYHTRYLSLKENRNYLLLKDDDVVKKINDYFIDKKNNSNRKKEKKWKKKI